MLFYELRVAALGCLNTVLVSCGGFLDISTRSLIDSTILSGLVEMEKENTVFCSSAAIIGMLDLSLCCITTPWNDGSMTSLFDSIVRVARKCENNPDVNVCKSAKSLLMVCNTVSVPRAPALLYVSRATAGQQRQEPVPVPEKAATDIVNDLEKARGDIARAQRADEEMKKKKAERRKQEEEAEESIRKRKKVETPPQQKQDPTKSENSKTPKDDRKVRNKSEEKEQEPEPTQPAAPLVEEKTESPGPEANNDDSEAKDDESHETAPSSDKEDEPMEEADGDEFDFPEIVEGGGPDSDDE